MDLVHISFFSVPENASISGDPSVIPQTDFFHAQICCNSTTHPVDYICHHQKFSFPRSIKLVTSWFDYRFLWGQLTGFPISRFNFRFVKTTGYYVMNFLINHSRHQIEINPLLDDRQFFKDQWIKNSTFKCGLFSDMKL